MDRFHLIEVEGRDHEGPHLGVEVLVNDRPLRDMILDAEAEFRPDGVDLSWQGDLSNLRISEHTFSPWLAIPEHQDLGRWIPIYTCGCGIFGCGGFVARLSAIPGDMVLWSDLADAYWHVAAAWDAEAGAEYPQWRRMALSQVGPFRFEFDAYVRAIADFAAGSGG